MRDAEHRDRCATLALASTDRQLGGMVTVAVGLLLERFGRDRGVAAARELVDVAIAWYDKGSPPDDPS